jgi:hypothetical protein
MAIMATDTGGGDFKLATPGNHPAVCTMVADLGKQRVQSAMYGDSIKHQVYVRWELTDEPFEWQDKDTGVSKSGNMSIGKTFTLSLHENSTLRPILESWRGKPFTEEERKGFDITKLAGAACLVNVAHEVGNDGKTRAKVSAVTPIMKGMEKPTPLSTPLIYEDEHMGAYDDLPEWLRTRINDQVKETTNAPARGGFADDDLDDLVPF